jgi:hypothetical protein
MTSLVDQIVAVAESLDRKGVPWAFGGAFALAYATAEPRGTRGIDVNVFVPASRAAEVFTALPKGVRHNSADLRTAQADDQVRLFWSETPIDIFFAADDFHHNVDGRCTSVAFAGRTVRVLCAEDLAVFKALFDRPKDWVDIASMAEAGTINLNTAADRLAALIPDDSRVPRLRTIATSP